jgi:LPPG:FO 2-phospho-L-lactate transferase
MYTLAGIDNREWGWGLEGETFAAASMLERYGEESWFRLGDRDLATHIVRTARLRRGDRPTAIALDLQRALGVPATILPMCDEPVRTEVRTDEGWLEFQDYFVRRHQEPTVHEVRFRGIEGARATPEVEAALGAARAIVIATSNPFVSVRPMLSVGVGPDLQRGRGGLIAAVSGIVGGTAIRGRPTGRRLGLRGRARSAWRAVLGPRRPVRARQHRRGSRGADRRPRHANPRDRHDHDRRCRAGAARGRHPRGDRPWLTAATVPKADRGPRR